MTDSDHGMEGSDHRYRKLIRTAVPTALLAGVLAVAGCGGGGSNSSSKPPAPVNQTSSTPGAGSVVSAEGTQGLVGSAGRATKKSQQFDDKTGVIPGTANRKPKHANGVGGEISCDNSDVTPSDSNTDQVNAAILCLVNGERADQSLPALSSNDQLAKAATGMCQRMVTEHFFAHETPDGKNVVDRVTPTGYIPDSGDWVVGENLAWGSGALSTPQAIVNGWMNSPGHKANILAPDYKDVGLAACQGSPSTQASGGTTYVNDFGAKSGADVNAKLPAEDGSTSGDSGTTGGDTSGGNTSTSNGQATAASKKAAAKAKKSKKSRKHKKRKH
jgi:uncharacterized protein YkwD